MNAHIIEPTGSGRTIAEILDCSFTYFEYRNKERISRVTRMFLYTDDQLSEKRLGIERFKKTQKDYIDRLVKESRDCSIARQKQREDQLISFFAGNESFNILNKDNFIPDRFAEQKRQAWFDNVAARNKVRR